MLLSSMPPLLLVAALFIKDIALNVNPGQRKVIYGASALVVLCLNLWTLLKAGPMAKLMSSLERYLSLKFILGLGLLARLIMLFFYPDQNFPDAHGYTSSGKAFFETGVITTDFHMPLYYLDAPFRRRVLAEAYGCFDVYSLYLANLSPFFGVV